MKKRLLLAILITILMNSISTLAQTKLSFEDVFDKGVFRQERVAGFNWMRDGNFYTSLEGNKVIKFDINNGEVAEVLLDANNLNKKIKIIDYTFSKDETKLLIETDRNYIYRRSYVSTYYIYNLATKKLASLSDNGKQAYATFSPDGTKIGFTRSNNLFYVDLENNKEVQVTFDGKFNEIINGSSDWVYEEELYLTKAFFWSPEGDNIAFYRFDESEVRKYNMQKWNDGDLYPEDYTFKYPKAGEKNSKVDIKVYSLDSKEIQTIDLGSETDIYIPSIQWTNNNDILAIRKLNRLQNELILFHADVETGKVQKILSEKLETYIDINYYDKMVYLKDGKHFIRTSEKDGYKHIYLYDMQGNEVRQITKGDWEATELLGVDERKRKVKVYFKSTEKSPLQRHFYSITWDGKNKKQLTTDRGYHSIDLSPDFKYYVDSYSNSNQPTKASLYETKKNSLVKVLKHNEKLEEVVEGYNLGKVDFITFQTTDNTELNGFMIKPADFSETRKYPVLIFQYSGPGSQSVLDVYSGSHYYWHQLLAQEGYIIACIDNRGTGGRGADFKKMTYAQLGKIEAEDHIAFAKYLQGLPYINSERIGIWGWSYGGYMSSLCMMLAPELFKAGIAVAPVTSWRYYDTIYTERYLKTPQQNASGYDDYSPITHASKLEGKFLLIHGTGDDNVHFQNTVALQSELIKYGKMFDTFIYPDRAHSLRAGGARKHVYRLMFDYIVRNL